MRYIFLAIILFALVLSPIALFVAGYTEWWTSGGYLYPLPVRVHQTPSKPSVRWITELATGDKVLYIGVPD